MLPIEQRGRSLIRRFRTLGGSNRDIVTTHNNESVLLPAVVRHLITLGQEGFYSQNDNLMMQFQHCDVYARDKEGRRWLIGIVKSASKNRDDDTSVAISAYELHEEGKKGRFLSIDTVSYSGRLNRKIEVNMGLNDPTLRTDNESPLPTNEDRSQLLRDVLDVRFDPEATKRAFDEAEARGDHVHWVRENEPLLLASGSN